MKKYVLAFLFTEDLKNVWLIEKQKPEWQKGCLNGIGGKIEDSDGSPLMAAQRELIEEAGTNALNLIEVGCIQETSNSDNSFHVEIFTGKTVQKLKTQEEEQIKLIPVNEVKNYKHIGNVPSLIELCLYRLNSTTFKTVTLNY